MKTHRTVLLVLTLLCLLPVCASWAADVAAAESPAAAQIEPRLQHAFPWVGKYEVLACDFHMHTGNSDGKFSPRERVLEAYRYGYDAIAITDHGNYKAYAEVRDLADCLGIVLIRGLETGIAKKEHFVVLGVSEDYQPRDPHKWSEAAGEATVYYQDELKRIAECGGVVVHAHPHMGYREPLQWGIESGIVQGIEVKNGVVGSGWNTVESHGTHCYPFAFDWALEHNLALFADSDVHKTRSGDSQPVTLVFAKKRTGKEVMGAIRARRTAAWFDGMLWGREELLSDLVKAVVNVRRTTDANGASYFRIENRGPVDLKAAVEGEGIPNQPLQLKPYQETLVICSGAPGTLVVRWENLWISPKDNLRTTYNFGSRD